MCDQHRLRSACAYAQSEQSLCKSLEYFMTVKRLTEHILEVLSFKGGCTGSSESILVKMTNCWKSHAAAHLKKNGNTNKFILYSITALIILAISRINLSSKNGNLDLYKWIVQYSTFFTQPAVAQLVEH